MTIPARIILIDGEIELALNNLSTALEQRAAAISDALARREITPAIASKLRNRSRYNASLRAFGLEEHFDLPKSKLSAMSLLEWDRGIQ